MEIEVFVEERSVVNRAKNMKAMIEQTLSVLIGTQFLDSGRAANMQMFGFRKSTGGRSRKGRLANDFHYALHVQCPWRLVGADGIVAGYHDYYYAPGDYDDPPDGWEWEKTNRCDERMKSFFDSLAKSRLIVRGVRADRIGTLQVRFSDKYVLEAFPDDSRPDEHWRFFRVDKKKRHFVDGKKRHFVVTGSGIL
jgi:hypothetical protein